MNDQKLNDWLEEIIDPPYGMRGIQGVADVLSEVLQRVWLIKLERDFPEGESSELLTFAPHLKKLCLAIANQTELSGRWIETGDAVTQFKTAHPIYGCLDALSKAGTLSGAHLQLVAHSLVAANHGLPDKSGNSAMPSANLQAAFRELRRLDSSVLDSVRFELPSRHACYKALREAEYSEEVGLSNKEKEQLGDIRRLIGLSLGIEKPHEVPARKKGGEAPGRNAQIDTAIISSTQLDEVEGESLSLIETPLCDAKGLESARLEALATGDVAPRVRQVIPSDRANPKKGGSIQRSALQARYHNDQIRRNAQALSSRWDRLTEFDVAQAISTLSWAGAGCATGVLATGLLLFTGRPLSTVLNARLYASVDEVPGRISRDSIAICYEGGFIQVQVPVPERERPMRAEWQACVRQADNQLRLPIVRLIWDLLVDFIGEAGGGWHGYLFPRADLCDLEMGARDVISGLRSEEGTRATETRLQRCLFNQIADVSGDVVDAVFITGNQPSTGTHVGTHYYCVPEADLQCRFLEAVKGLLVDDPKGLLAPVARCSHRHHYIGSPLCPKPEWLAAFVSNLRQSLKRPRETLLDANTLIEIHNSFTTYVVMFLAFATGYRSVQAPLSRSTDYDPVSRMLVVADKTDSAFSHARLEPVPEMLAQQLDLYKQHRERVADQMWSLLGIEEPQHFLFFLSKAAPRVKQSKKLVRVTPVSELTLKANLGAMWDLPLNVNRHYLRSELRHRGVHAELVDAWMGHWLDGQEPMGRYSSLNPLDYAAGIEPVLTELLEEMGLMPEEGL